MRGCCVLSGVSIRRWRRAVPVKNVVHKCAGVIWWSLCVSVSTENLGMRACVMSVILGYWVKAFFRLICFKRDRMCLPQCSGLCGLDCMWVCLINMKKKCFFAYLRPHWGSGCVRFSGPYLKIICAVYSWVWERTTFFPNG